MKLLITGVSELLGNNLAYYFRNKYEILGLYNFHTVTINGIQTPVHYIPVHMQPYCRNKYGCKEWDYPIAEKCYNKALSLPIYPGMLDKEVEKVVDSVI